MLSFDQITTVSLIMVVVSVFYFLIRNDEMPLLLSVFLLFAGPYRYYAVTEGVAIMVVVAYAKNIFDYTHELMFISLQYMFWGSFMLWLSYLVTAQVMPREEKGQRLKDDPEMLKLFLRAKYNRLLMLGGAIIGISSISTVFLFRAYGMGMSANFGLSYLIMFGFAAGGLMILLLLFLISSGRKLSRVQKIVLGISFVYLAYTTYNPNFRFTLIGWTVAGLFLYVRGRSSYKKSFLYLVGGGGLLLAFSIGGLVRNPKYKDLSKFTFEELSYAAFERFVVAEDVNFLDGFMMIIQVYPDYLDYQKGFAHFEILLRPIPRAIWPGKPVGGYANRLGLNDNMGGGGVGISPSIYGTFYEEGGVVGIFLFSVIYGVVFYRIRRYAFSYGSQMRYVVIGVFYATLFALLRAGDIAGIAAFFGMTYWPIILFNYWYKKFRRQYRARQRRLIIAKALLQQRQQQNQIANL